MLDADQVDICGNLAVNGDLTVNDILPSQTDTYDLGSPEFRFKDLYLSEGTLYTGNTTYGENGISTESGTFSVTGNVAIKGNLGFNGAAPTGSIELGFTDDNVTVKDILDELRTIGLIKKKEVQQLNQYAASQQVNEVSEEEGKYTFNSDGYDAATNIAVYKGTYKLNIPTEFPIGFVFKSDEQAAKFIITGGTVIATKTIKGVSVTYYDGEINIEVTGNFGTISYGSDGNGWMGGQNRLTYEPLVMTDFTISGVNEVTSYEVELKDHTTDDNDLDNVSYSLSVDTPGVSIAGSTLTLVSTDITSDTFQVTATNYGSNSNTATGTFEPFAEPVYVWTATAGPATGDAVVPGAEATAGVITWLITAFGLISEYPTYAEQLSVLMILGFIELV